MKKTIWSIVVAVIIILIVSVRTQNTSNQGASKSPIKIGAPMLHSGILLHMASEAWRYWERRIAGRMRYRMLLRKKIQALDGTVVATGPGRDFLSGGILEKNFMGKYRAA